MEKSIQAEDGEDETQKNTAMCDAVLIFFGFVLRDCESVDLGLPAKPTNRLVRRMQLSGDFLASPISRRPGQVVAA